MGAEIIMWYGLFAGPHPENIVRRLRDEVVKGLNTPDIRQRLLAGELRHHRQHAGGIRRESEAGCGEVPQSHPRIRNAEAVARHTAAAESQLKAVSS